MNLRALLLATWLGWAGIASTADAAESDEPPPGLMPRYLLRDANGRAVTEGDFRGRFQLITFGYTACPDVCPTTLVEMGEILKLLGGEARRLQAIFISVDPARDTPALLKDYTAFFDPRILGLTAAPEFVKAAADRFKVRYEIAREPGAPPGQYAVDHSAGMYLLGPDGRFVRKFAYGTSYADVAERIAEAMAATDIRPPPRRARPGRE